MGGDGWCKTICYAGGVSLIQITRDLHSPSFGHRGHGIAGISVTLVVVHCPLHWGLCLRLNRRERKKEKHSSKINNSKTENSRRVSKKTSFDLSAYLSSLPPSKNRTVSHSEPLKASHYKWLLVSLSVHVWLAHVLSTANICTACTEMAGSHTAAWHFVYHSRPVKSLGEAEKIDFQRYFPLNPFHSICGYKVNIQESNFLSPGLWPRTSNNHRFVNSDMSKSLYFLTSENFRNWFVAKKRFSTSWPSFLPNHTEKKIPI